MDVITILKDLWRTKNLQVFINHRFKDDSVILVRKDMFKYIITKDNIKLTFDDNVYIWQDFKDEYRVYDIQPGTKFIDIGANVGSVSIYAAKKGARVTAIEPIENKKLLKNISINNVSGLVKPITGAL